MRTRLCVLGEPEVGKTSLIHAVLRRYGVSPNGRLDVLGQPLTLRLHGSEEQDTLDVAIYISRDTANATTMKTLCQEAAGALIVCDLTRPETLDTSRFYANLFRLNHPDYPIVFAANKADAAVLTPSGTADVAELGAAFEAPWFACSALTGAGVAEAFEALGRAVLHLRSVSA